MCARHVCSAHTSVPILPNALSGMQDEPRPFFSHNLSLGASKSEKDLYDTRRKDRELHKTSLSQMFIKKSLKYFLWTNYENNTTILSIIMVWAQSILLCSLSWFWLDKITTVSTLALEAGLSNFPSREDCTVYKTPGNQLSSLYWKHPQDSAMDPWQTSCKIWPQSSCWIRLDKPPGKSLIRSQDQEQNPEMRGEEKAAVRLDILALNHSPHWCSAGSYFPNLARCLAHAWQLQKDVLSETKAAPSKEGSMAGDDRLLL